MTRILNCIVISDKDDIVPILSNVMKIKGDFYADQVNLIAPVTGLSEDYVRKVEKADLIFADNRADMAASDLSRVLASRPQGAAIIALCDDKQGTREARQRIRDMGADDVMTLAELESDIGRRLMESIVKSSYKAQLQNEVTQSEERFRDIIEHSHDIMVLLDSEGCIIYTSQAFERQMQYQSWEVLGQYALDFVHEEDQASTRSGIKELFSKQDGAAVNMYFRFRRQDGDWRYIEAKASNLLNNPNIQAIVMNARDDTDRKSIELELERYRQHLEDLVERRTKEVAAANRRVDTYLAASPDTLIAIDIEGYITYASQHYRQRYPQDAAIFTRGMHILDAFAVIARYIPLSPTDARYEEMKSWWQNPQGTREFRQAGGMWTRLQAKKMESGETVISTTDITDYKRQQAMLASQSSEMKAALATERQLVEQQKTFISMVSHEFRTPLSIIDGNAQIILNRGSALPKDMLERRAVTIRAAVDRLIRLIETILSSHMIETGKITLNPVECDLATLIRDVAGDQQDLAPSHKIKVDIGDIPQQMMLDEKLMRQILTNLLSNAVKYSPENPDIEIAVSEDESRFIEIRVTDHGVGIPDDEQGKIFSKYFRASTSGGIPGSGLGLTLVKQFVEMHNGSISLQSRVGEGTTMLIQLPIVPAITLE